MMKAGEIDGYMLKPMNCPHHVKIYASQARSYRNLPLRLAEFGTVYRWEQSGEISGLTRVRGFTQDDAHLFVTEDQLADEVLGCIELVQIIFDKLGMEDYRVRVGLRDPDSSSTLATPSAGTKPKKRAGQRQNPSVCRGRRKKVKRLSTDRKLTLWSKTSSVANGSWEPSKSITTSRSASI